MAEREDLSFDEFKSLILALVDGLEIPRREGSIGDRMLHFLKSGCTEIEFKRWLAKNIWDFDDQLRDAITMLLAADALHQAAKHADAESVSPPASGGRSTL